MPTPQHGIFALGTRSHHHLQLDIAPGVTAADVADKVREIRARGTTIAGVNLVVGYGADFCRQAAPQWLPADLAPFADIDGPGGSMPADQHDLWLWFHASGPDAVFDLARYAACTLDGLATVVREQPAFTYLSSQDMTGFEDGTENPPVDEAPAVACIPDGSPGAGGSVVLLQRWVHDLDSFEELSDDDQNQVFGRDKATKEELPDDVRSERAHISRVVVEDDEGEELEVFRRSTAYGGVLEHGLVFLAFSADVDRLDHMMRRMVGTTDDALTDRLLDFSRPVESAWYVAPPLEAFAP